MKEKGYEKELALEQADLIVKNTYRTLMTRGMKGCYVYFEDKALAEHFRSLLVKNYAEALEEVELSIAAEEEQSALLPDQDDTIRIEPTVNDNVRYVDFLPFYSVHAACGYFGDGEHVDVEGWVDITQLGRKVNRWMFAVRACGHSMEPNIRTEIFASSRLKVVGLVKGKLSWLSILINLMLSIVDATLLSSIRVRR